MSDSVTLWTVACQAPLSTGSSRQEYWSVLPCPSPRDLPNPGIERVSLMFLALTGGFFTTDITWEAYSIGSTNSLIFTLYGMARQSIISSVLCINLYNAWSKKEVWLLDNSSNVSTTALKGTPLWLSHNWPDLSMCPLQHVLCLTWR